MLAGRPVIATRGGGVTEIIDDGTGLLVPPNDAAALARPRSQSLAADPGVAAADSRRAERRARERSSARPAMVRGVEEAIADLL